LKEITGLPFERISHGFVSKNKVNLLWHGNDISLSIYNDSCFITDEKYVKYGGCGTTIFDRNMQAVDDPFDNGFECGLEELVDSGETLESYMNATECVHCGKRICSEDESCHTDEDGDEYCEDCWYEHVVFTCHNCGEETNRNVEFEVDDGEHSVCEHCYENYYVTCEDCGGNYKEKKMKSI
jgi:hypothetical protein